jgi:hypothetical protein
MPQSVPCLGSWRRERTGPRTGPRPALVGANGAHKYAVLAVRRVARIAERLAYEGQPIAAASTGTRGHDAPLLRVQR